MLEQHTWEGAARRRPPNHKPRGSKQEPKVSQDSQVLIVKGLLAYFLTRFVENLAALDFRRK